jgi:hypothetical protein
MNTLKYFRIMFWIRWEINENVLIPRMGEYLGEFETEFENILGC